MKLTFKLYASLTEFLPTEAKAHAIVLDVEDGTSVFDVLDQFRVPRERAYLFLLNGVFVSPEERDKPILRDGDTLAIWPPVAGG